MNPKGGVLCVTACLLLTSAATAHAECAWVLWFQDSVKRAGTGLLPPERQEWEIIDTYKSKEQCQAAVASLREEWRRIAQVTNVDRYALIDFGNDLSITREIRCLPDAVDPRGPKGGGR